MDDERSSELVDIANSITRDGAKLALLHAVQAYYATCCLSDALVKTVDPLTPEELALVIDLIHTVFRRAKGRTREEEAAARYAMAEAKISDLASNEGTVAKSEFHVLSSGSDDGDSYKSPISPDSHVSAPGSDKERTEHPKSPQSQDVKHGPPGSNSNVEREPHSPTPSKPVHNTRSSAKKAREHSPPASPGHASKSGREEESQKSPTPLPKSKKRRAHSDTQTAAKDDAELARKIRRRTRQFSNNYD